MKTEDWNNTDLLGQAHEGFNESIFLLNGYLGLSQYCRTLGSHSLYTLPLLEWILEKFRFSFKKDCEYEASGLQILPLCT